MLFSLRSPCLHVGLPQHSIFWWEVSSAGVPPTWRSCGSVEWRHTSLSTNVMFGHARMSACTHVSLWMCLFRRLVTGTCSAPQHPGTCSAPQHPAEKSSWLSAIYMRMIYARKLSVSIMQYVLFFAVFGEIAQFDFEVSCATRDRDSESDTLGVVATDPSLSEPNSWCPPKRDKPLPVPVLAQHHSNNFYKLAWIMDYWLQWVWVKCIVLLQDQSPAKAGGQTGAE